MKFGDREYAITLAGDVPSDAMLLDLDDVTAGGRETVADVRCAGADGMMTFSAYRPEIPLKAVEHFITEAR